MRIALVDVMVASLAFVGTMFDNLFAFASQLIVTDPARHRRVAWAQSLGVLTLIALAAGVGTLLAVVPTRWVGLLAVAPWALAAHAWRHRGDARRQQFRRGAITTFTITLALGGDNLAVWIPLLRAGGSYRGLATAATFMAWEALFVSGAIALARHPRVVTWGSKWGPSLVPWVYLGLGVMILVECHTFG
jgi:cadmium resistance protein CadD (predicted permease)